RTMTTESGDMDTGDIHWTFGGSGRNVGVWLTHLGSGARFIGFAGADAVGMLAESHLRSLGLDISIVRGGRTPTVLSLVSAEGQRHLVVDEGGPFHGYRLKHRATGKWLHLPGFLIYRRDTRPQAVAIAARRDAATRLSIDVNSAATLARFGV